LVDRGIRLVIESGRPVAQVAADLGMHPEALRKRVRQAEIDLRCWEGMVFFAFMIDAFSRRVVGWQLAAHMRSTLVLDALRVALGTRQPGADVERVHHSDRGSQYTSLDFTQELRAHPVLQSVGSVGDAYDNAMAESFGARRVRARRRVVLVVP